MNARLLSLSIVPALGATSLGAIALAGPLANNSVTTRHLRNSAVTSLKLATNAVGRQHIAGGAVSTAKLDPSIGFFSKSQDASTLSHGSLFVTPGAVGLGVASPSRGRLEVVGNVNRAGTGVTNATYMTTGTAPITNLSDAGTATSIFATDTVVGANFFAISDARVKVIEGRSDPALDLRTLLGIEVTDYRYKDAIQRGGRPQKKGIAQQIESVFPQAVSRHTDVVPDLFAKARTEDGWVFLATDLKAGDRVRLLTDGEDGLHEVTEVREGSFRAASLPAGGEVFVYGREVDDFRTVDYEAIAMLNVSATQELARRLEAKDAEISRLTRWVETLEARDRDREDRLARLESAIGSESPRSLQAPARAR